MSTTETTKSQVKKGVYVINHQSIRVFEQLSTEGLSDLVAQANEEAKAESQEEMKTDDVEGATVDDWLPVKLAAKLAAIVQEQIIEVEVPDLEIDIISGDGGTLLGEVIEDWFRHVDFHAIACLFSAGITPDGVDHLRPTIY